MTDARPFLIYLIAFLSISGYVPILCAAEEETLPDVETIVRKADELHRSDSSYAEMEMTIVTKNWERTLEIEAWTEDMDRTFMVVKAPAKERGMATLRIENEMWNYFPRIDKVMKIPPSMMMGEWMGSDFTNDDLVKESTLIDDYNGKLVTPEDAQPEYYYIELVPKENTVTVWGKILLVVRKEDYLPERQVYFDEKGKEMRRMLFTDIREFDGKKLPSVLEMVPLSKKKKGNKTIVKYKEAKFDIELPEDTFTLREPSEETIKGNWFDMILFRMAFRNVLRHRRRSFLTGLMIVGGFTLCSVSLGFSEGSYSSIIDLFTRDHTGHIQIHKEDYLDNPSLYKTIDLSKIPLDEIRELRHFVSMSPRILASALAFKESKTTAAQIVGIDPTLESSTTRIAKKIDKGRYLSEEPAYEAVIGSGLADILKAELDDEVALYTQAADGSAATDMFKIVGIIGKAGGSYDKMKCYIHIKTVSRFLELDSDGQERVHEIAVLLDSQRYARKTAQEISKVVGRGDVDVQPWQVVEKQFYRAMQVDNKGNYISQGIIVAIVAVGVLNTVLMSILERTREFGVLRAVGTRPLSVFLLIILETLLLSLMAIALAVILSSGINYYLSIRGFTLSTPVNYGGVEFKTMISAVTPKTLIIPAIATLLAASVVSIFPGIRAARIKPVKAMSSN